MQTTLIGQRTIPTFWHLYFWGLDICSLGLTSLPSERKRNMKGVRSLVRFLMEGATHGLDQASAVPLGFALAPALNRR
jgi:hypothetical protein